MIEKGYAVLDGVGHAQPILLEIDICGQPFAILERQYLVSDGPARRFAREQFAPFGPEAGRELGRHKGLIHYTVGQRRGLELGGLAEPLYVIRLEPEAQQVIVGPKAALAVTRARLSETTWLGDTEGRAVMAKVRSLAKPVPARIAGEWLCFDAPEFGVSPGQAAVLYDEERVLGGGWIEETVGADLVTA